MTIEQGIIGGVPSGGAIRRRVKPGRFSRRTVAVRLLQRGGLDFAALGLAQATASAMSTKANTARPSPAAAALSTFRRPRKKMVFLRTFTTGGLDVLVKDGRIDIRSEGRMVKFKKDVDQHTFSGKFAREHGETCCS
jgi:propionate CoA-transferase